MEINTKTMNIPLIVHVVADVVAISSLAYVVTTTKKKLSSEIAELRELNKQQAETIARLQKDMMKLSTNMTNIVTQLNHKVLTTPTEIQRIPATPREEVRVVEKSPPTREGRIIEVLSSIPEVDSFDAEIEEELAEELRDLRPIE
jgi:hypothetical protein